LLASVPRRLSRSPRAVSGAPEGALDETVVDSSSSSSSSSDELDVELAYRWFGFGIAVVPEPGRGTLAPSDAAAVGPLSLGGGCVSLSVRGSPSCAGSGGASAGDSTGDFATGFAAAAAAVSETSLPSPDPCPSCRRPAAEAGRRVLPVEPRPAASCASTERSLRGGRSSPPCRRKTEMCRICCCGSASQGYWWSRSPPLRRLTPLPTILLRSTPLPQTIPPPRFPQRWTWCSASGPTTSSPLLRWTLWRWSWCWFLPATRRASLAPADSPWSRSLSSSSWPSW